MEQNPIRVRSQSTEGLVMKRYNTFMPLISTFPTPPPDKFEKYMFSLLKRMKELHQEAYGKQATKVLLGRFERERFKDHIEYGGDKVYKEHYIPDSFPMDELMSSVGEQETVFVDTATRTKSKRVYLLEGLEVKYIDEPFHFEATN